MSRKRTADGPVTLAARLAILATLAIVAACGDSEPPPDPEPVAAPPAGVYTGRFPCDGCPEIPTALWLQDNGSYFLEQVYPAGDGGRQAVTSLGRWSWLSETETLVLESAGPSRQFRRPDAESLIMQSPSPLEHRLVRDRARGPFTAAVSVEGTLDARADGAVFAECLTGLRIPVSRGADYASFARQYRHVGAAGAPAFVAFEARFRWRDDGSLAAIVIDRFDTIRADGRC